MAAAVPTHGHRCPPPFNGFLKPLAALGVDLTNGTIVNVGATLTHPGFGNKHSNQDESWRLFWSHATEKRMRMVAFEPVPTPSHKETLDRMLNVTGGDVRDRVAMLYEYVDPNTIVRVLRQHGVPSAFPLLKIDIDSLDFHVFAAIVQHFEPALVFVEKYRSHWMGRTIRFAALGGLPGQTPPPRYRREGLAYWDYLKNFMCCSASPAMWVEHAPSFGYEVYQEEGIKNLLLVRSELRALLPRASSNLTCFSPDPPPGAARWPLANTYRSINKACNATNTPYTVEHGGECCPKQIDGVPTDVSEKWCRCDVLVQRELEAA